MFSHSWLGTPALEGKMMLPLAVFCRFRFLHFFIELLIVETRLKTFLRDNIKLLLLKQNFCNNLSFLATPEAFNFQGFSNYKHSFLRFFLNAS